MQVMNACIKAVIPRGEEFLKKISTAPKWLDEMTSKKFVDYGVAIKAEVTEFFDRSPHRLRCKLCDLYLLLNITTTTNRLEEWMEEEYSGKVVHLC